MRRFETAALAAALALTLAACGSGDSSSDSTSDSTSAATTGYDTSSITKVDDIAAMVPAAVSEDGKLTVGDNIYYAPAEFYAEDGTTPIGYDIDLANALAKVMGLELDLQNAEFSTILPGLPDKFEMAIANISVNEDRMANFNMIPYFATGSTWTVTAGNTDFDPTNICGTSVGVQTGTVQDEEIATLAESCDGDLDVQRYDQQSAVTTALVGGKFDAMYTDSSVADYAVSQTAGQLETTGETTGVVPIGITTAKSDTELAEATQAALQYLIDQGILADIFDAWGITDQVATTAEINPAL